MALARKPLGGGKPAKPNQPSVFAYSEAPERIRALAFSDFAGVDQVTIFSPKRLPGLTSSRPKRITLRGHGSGDC